MVKSRLFYLLIGLTLLFTLVGGVLSTKETVFADDVTPLFSVQ